MPTGIFNIKDQVVIRKELRNHSTSAEAVFWRRFKGRQVGGLKFRRQYGVGSYVVDFYCPEMRLAVELDGAVHKAPLAYEHDELRTCYLQRCNIRVLRFTNDVVFSNIEGIVQQILELKDRLGLGSDHPAFGTPPEPGGEDECLIGSDHPAFGTPPNSGGEDECK